MSDTKDEYHSFKPYRHDSSKGMPLAPCLQLFLQILRHWAVLSSSAHC